MAAVCPSPELLPSPPDSPQSLQDAPGASVPVSSFTLLPSAACAADGMPSERDSSLPRPRAATVTHMDTHTPPDVHVPRRVAPTNSTSTSVEASATIAPVSDRAQPPTQDDNEEEEEEEAMRQFLRQWQAEEADEAAEAAHDRTPSATPDIEGSDPEGADDALSVLAELWDEEHAAMDPTHDVGSDGDDDMDDVDDIGDSSAARPPSASTACAAAAPASASAAHVVHIVDDDSDDNEGVIADGNSGTDSSAGGVQAAPSHHAATLARCPICQVPLHVATAEHVSECLAGFVAPRRKCPAGAGCASDQPQHFAKMAHAELALALANRRPRRFAAGSASASALTTTHTTTAASSAATVTATASGKSGTGPPPAKRALLGAWQPTLAKLFGWREKPVAATAATAGSQQTGGRRASAGRGSGSASAARGGPRSSWGAGASNRKCPFYKRVTDTTLTVDAFSYGAIEGCRAYLLSHFHSDHYGGLTRAFTGRIYCSAITARLVVQRLGVAMDQITVLDLETPTMVEGVRVTLIDANHCPGAVLFLFELPSGRRMLHTGDFRASPAIWDHSLLRGRPLHTVYLDTTYCKETHTFPSQTAVLNFAAMLALQKQKRAGSGRLLVVVGSYTIGKERVFRAVADALGAKIWAQADKRRVLRALHDDELNAQLTDDATAADVHVASMGSLRLDALVEYAARPAVARRYDRVLGLRPTGWSHNRTLPALAHIKPQRSGNVEVYGLPYSEHSSYTELKRFIQALRPQRIIPTVNVGSEKSRRAMALCFQRWMKDAAKARPTQAAKALAGGDGQTEAKKATS